MVAFLPTSMQYHLEVIGFLFKLDTEGPLWISLDMTPEQEDLGGAKETTFLRAA